MNFYAWVVLDRDHAPERARRALQQVYAPARVQPHAALSLRITRPLLPSDFLAEGPAAPPLLSFLELESDDPRGRVLVDAALEALAAAPLGPVARGGLAWPQDAALVALSRTLGGCLGLAWQDDPDLAYAALARDGRLLWSLAVRPGQAHVRFDGVDIQRGSPRDRLDVVDRVEVLREGLSRLLGERIPLNAEEALTLPDTLAELLLEAEEAAL